MIGRERRGGDVVGPGASLVRTDEDDDALGDGNLKQGRVELNLGFAKLRVTKKKVAALIAVGVFVWLLNTRMIEGPEEANRCYAVLMFCTLLWATEVLRAFFSWWSRVLIEF
jgi:phosphate transporter